MAISILQTVNSSVSASPTITLSGTTAGSTLVVAVWEFLSSPGASVSGISDGSSTYTKIEAQNNIDDNGFQRYYGTELWYAFNVAAGITSITVSFNGGPSSAAFTVREYSGLTTSDPLDKHTSHSAGGTSITSNATATTTQASELVVGAARWNGNSSATLSAGSGYGNYNELDAIAGFQLLGIEDKTVSSTGAQTATFTGGGSATLGQGFSCIVATFLAAPPAPLSINKSESTTVTENLPLMVESYINNNDSATVNDQPFFNIPGYNFSVNVSDISTVTDGPNVLIAELVVIVNDGSGVTESAPVSFGNAINVSDTSAITDNMPVMAEADISKSDSTIVTENVVMMMENSLNDSDTTTVSDAVIVVIGQLMTTGLLEFFE